MKWVTGALCGLGFVGSLGALLWGVQLSRPTAGHADVAGGKPGLESSRATSSSGAAETEEVRYLRTELRRKDALLSALSKQQAAAQEAPSPAELPEPHVDPVARAVDVLDERMFLAPNGTRQAVEMEHAVRDAVDAVTWNDTKVSSLYCTSALCKLTLSAPTAESMNQSMHALSGQLSKTISNTLVLELDNGESAVYLAQSSEALDVPPAR